MKALKKIFKDWLSLLTFTIVLGIALLSLGIYLIGIKVPNANLLVIAGSFLFYVSVIALAFKI